MDTNALVYTEWDHRLEENCHAVLLIVKRACEDFYKSFISEINKQANIVDRLWELGQRYLLLKRAVPSFSTYSHVITSRVEQEILNEINEHLKTINKSKYRYLRVQGSECLNYQLLSFSTLLCTGICQVKQSIVEFENVVTTVDPRCGSLFVQGSTKRKPIFFYIEIVRDIYFIFKKSVGKLDFGQKLIDCCDPATIEIYRKLITPPLKLSEFLKLQFSAIN